jgi:hypothetical protein
LQQFRNQERRRENDQGEVKPSPTQEMPTADRRPAHCEVQAEGDPDNPIQDVRADTDLRRGCMILDEEGWDYQQREKSERPTSWQAFLRAHWNAVLAADFFTTEVWTARPRHLLHAVCD